MQFKTIRSNLFSNLSCIGLFFIGFIVNSSLANAQVSLDTSFGTNGIATLNWGGAYDDIENIALQDNGKILAVGTGSSSNRFSIARFDTNGDLDNSFSGDGRITYTWSAGSPGVAALENDKILIGLPDFESPRSIRTIRLNDNGTTDTSYGIGGEANIPSPSQVHVNGMVIQPDGSAVTVGADYFGSTTWDGVVSRFLQDGTPDSNFGTGGQVLLDFSRPEITNPIDRLSSIALQPDGKIVVGGFSSTTSSESTGNRIHSLARLLSDGSLDTTFGTGGLLTLPFQTGPIHSEYVSHLTILDDGKILAASGGGSDTSLFRLNSNGSLDTTFGSSGRIIAPAGAVWDNPTQVLFDDQGRMLINSDDFSVTRLDQTGALDTSFGSGGTFNINFPGVHSARATTMAWQDDGKLLVGGASTTVVNVSSDWRLARLEFSPPPITHDITIPATFDVKAIPSVPSIQDGDTGLLVGLGINEDYPEERAILEFSLLDIPVGATIESASLVVDPYGSSGSPRLEAFGYGGDGIASVADITESGSVLGTTGPVNASMPLITVDLDTLFIQSLLGNDSHLGIRLRSLDVPLYVAFLANESHFSLPNKPVLEISYSLPPIPGDFDGDGDVDNQDLSIWEMSFGVNDSADADGDGDSDGRDFLKWQQNYTGPLTTFAAAVSVPEPSTATIFLLTSALLATARRFRRRNQ